MKKLEEHGVKRNPQHNAAIESFFSTLRFALLTRTRFAGPDEAKRYHGLNRAPLHPASTAHDAWGREPDQLRIDLESAEAEDIANLFTESR